MRNCCGCVKMQTGVMTIGSIGMIASIVALVCQFLFMAYQKVIMKNHDDQVGINLFTFVLIMGIVVCFFKLISDCLLIYGASKQTTREVAVWLAINLCTIIYVFIIMVFIYDLLANHDSIVEHRDILSFEAFLFIVNAFYIYMWYQVYIFSRQLDLDGRTSLEGILQEVNATRP
ncbi:uncharacterized protein LOC129574357 [Sitodiplosis mosellana]|uniref:uncharacterized protein LOC129574357 n=1 Tax=Sitodiplosis mosellana TaxID=263140 RepID=UPI002445396E|nr:uncharacterized protein LOC129574357 [Sitodiplosis mosellana]XP_055312236.1 uncharacterized protein LOC129574357 [Sitodiplosis mosellana]